jgi:hypothetical protein
VLDIVSTAFHIFLLTHLSNLIEALTLFAQPSLIRNLFDRIFPILKISCKQKLLILNVFKVIFSFHWTFLLKLINRRCHCFAANFAHRLAIGTNLHVHPKVFLVLLGLIQIAFYFSLKADVLFAIFSQWNLNFDDRLVFLLAHYNLIIKEYLIMLQ